MSGAPNDIAALLVDVRRRGVRLWVEGDELRYRAPKGILSDSELTKFRSARNEIIALLKEDELAVLGPRHVPRESFDDVPLTFSQLKYWRASRLETEPTIRSVTSITRLRGRLDLAALQRAIAEVVRRHESLRTSIVLIGNSPWQRIVASRDVCPIVTDLSGLAEHIREERAQALIRDFILEPVLVTRNPLFEAYLVKIDTAEQIMVLAMDHMIADGYSRDVLLREVLTAHEQLVRQLPISLPPIPIQYADFAQWLVKRQGSWDATHGLWWKEHLIGAERLRFSNRLLPNDSDEAGLERDTLEMLPIRIERELKTGLSNWSRQQGTTLVMTVFAAYALLVLRSCGASDAVIRYQSDGRQNSKLANCIGYFASVLHLRLELRDDDSFVTFVKRVVQEFCAACEHHDYNYIATRVPRPAFAGNPSFNWVGSSPGSSPVASENRTHDQLLISPLAVALPSRESYGLNSEPGVLLSESADAITGSLCFPRRRFDASAMSRFAGQFPRWCEMLMSRPGDNLARLLLQ